MVFLGGEVAQLRRVADHGEKCEFVSILEPAEVEDDINSSCPREIQERAVATLTVRPGDYGGDGRDYMSSNPVQIRGDEKSNVQAGTARHGGPFV